jgi:phage-related minor tail protein
MNRRALVEHMLKHRQLLLPQIASAPHDRFASLKNLERAEKRFLISFIMNIVGGTYFVLTSELWSLNLAGVASLPIPRLMAIILAVAMLLAGLFAVLAYLSIGLVIQRAVEITPRQEV